MILSQVKHSRLCYVYATILKNYLNHQKFRYIIHERLLFKLLLLTCKSLRKIGVEPRMLTQPFKEALRGLAYRDKTVEVDAAASVKGKEMAA